MRRVIISVAPVAAEAVEAVKNPLTPEEVAQDTIAAVRTAGPCFMVAAPTDSTPSASSPCHPVAGHGRRSGF